MTLIDTIILFLRNLFDMDSSKPTVKLDGNIDLVIEEQEVIVDDKEEIKDEPKKKTSKKKTSKKKTSKKKKTVKKKKASKKQAK